MAKGSNARLSGLRKTRLTQDILPLVPDMLVLWDFMLCIACAGLALWLYGCGRLRQNLNTGVYGLIPRDVILGSLVAALALRDAQLASPPRLAKGHWMYFGAERRCTLALGVLVLVGLTSYPTQQCGNGWLAAWLIMFSITFTLTRHAMSLYFLRNDQHASPREMLATPAGAEVEHRSVADLAASEDLAVFDGAQIEPSFLDDIDLFLELDGGVELDASCLGWETDQEADLTQWVDRPKASPTDLDICPHVPRSPPEMPEARILGGMPLTAIGYRPVKQRDLLIKALLDKIVAILLFVLLMPLLVAIAIAVVTTSTGPVIYRQSRQGWLGRSFVLFKFRTMRDAPDGRPCHYQTRRNDSRCTVVGKWLRSTSLDELPQLWNVLRGDMSLVGPRPHVDALHDLNRVGCEIVAQYAQRNRVKPGITGWAQIHGARGATMTEDDLRRRVAYDLYYIENWSLWLDIKILARTPFCLMGENVF